MGPLKKFPNSKIIVAPTKVSPGVGGKQKKSNAPFEHRYELSRRLFAKHPMWEKLIEVSAIEATLPVPNFTVRSLGALQKQFSTSSIGLLLGLDQLQAFGSWYQPFKIAEMASLIVSPRSSYSSQKGMRDSRNEIVNHLIRKEAKVAPLVVLLEGETCPVSSSEIRDSLFKRSSISFQWMSKDIQDYIIDNNLYV